LFLGDGDEIAEMTQFHGVEVYLFSMVSQAT